MSPQQAATPLDGKSLLVVAGDISADQHTGRLLTKLRELHPALRLWGVGGANMANAGVELLFDCQRFAVIGIIEILRLLPFFAKLKAHLIEEVAKRKPDAVLLVDFGGFNLNLALALRKKFPALPIIYFISPQVWGSRPWRMKVIEKTMSNMLVIFPFEESLYQRKGIPARFVGHPLVSKLDHESTISERNKFCADHGLDPTSPLIGIFPGSRRQEIKDLLPVVLQAASWLLCERPNLQFALSQANEYLAQAMSKEIDKGGYRKLIGKGIVLIPPGKSYDLMSSSNLIWAKSGTTTLEAALMGKPMLIFYRGNWLSYLIFLAFKIIKYVGWPNILAGEEIVPELIQLDCRAELFVRYTRDWMDVPSMRHEISNKLKAIRSRLGQGDFATNGAVELACVLGLSPAESH